MARFGKIFLGPFGEAPQSREALTEGTLLPGTAVELSAGAFVQAGTSSTGAIYVVAEQWQYGQGVGDQSVANDTLLAYELLPTQRLAVLVPTATSVAIGDALTINASGKFVKAVADDIVFAYADETYNNTSGADQLIAVRGTTPALTATS